MTMRQDAARRVSLAEARAARIGSPQVAGAYEQARLRFELAEAIRTRREEVGWSQRQLAERAGMSQPGIARFEAGGTTPTLPLLERLAAALGLTVSQAPRRPQVGLIRKTRLPAAPDRVGVRLPTLSAGWAIRDRG
jgi:HTH-type transcriptional regulator / antitoxin HipB